MVQHESSLSNKSYSWELTMGLSMMPRRNSRSMSLAPVEVGNSPRLSNTCCMAGWMKQETEIKIQTETERQREKRERER